MMSEKILKAKLRFVMPPNSTQADRFKAFIASRYDVSKENIELELIKDADLLGGFILRIGEDEYDWSLKGRAREIKLQAEKELSAYHFSHKKCC